MRAIAIGERQLERGKGLRIRARGRQSILLRGSGKAELNGLDTKMRAMGKLNEGEFLTGFQDGMDDQDFVLRLLAI